MPAPLRVGLIGVGRWGQAYIRTLRSLADRVRLTHLCTSNPRNARLLPYPVTVESAWQDAIRADCEAVIVATPPSTHAEILEGCLDAGKPCLIEKPLCLDLATAQRLHQRVLASQVPVLVDHLHLFHLAYEVLKDALKRAGAPLRLIVSEGGGCGPFRVDTPALWDWCWHDLSLCLDLMGEPPDHIEALGGPLGPDGFPEQVSLRLDFRGGACAWIQSGRLFQQKRRTLSVWTDTQLYVLDDLAPAPDQLTVAPIDFSRRYAGGIPDALERRPIALTSQQLPLARAVTYFLDGLAGGDLARFGTSLALEVTRALATCEVLLRTAQNHSSCSWLSLEEP